MLEGDEPRRQNHFRKIASFGGGQLGPFGINLLHRGLLVRVPGGAPTWRRGGRLVMRSASQPMKRPPTSPYDPLHLQQEIWLLASTSSPLSTREECFGSRACLSFLPSAVCISVYLQPNQSNIFSIWWVMALVDHCDSPGRYPGIGMIDSQ